MQLLRLVRLTAASAISLAAGVALMPTSPAAETTAAPPGLVRLFNAEFKLPPRSRWREERVMTAPDLKLAVDLGAEKSLKGTMSLLSRQVVNIDVLGEAELLLAFVQSERRGDIDFSNNHSRHATNLPLDGKTVRAVRSAEGRWSASLDGRRRPTPEEGAALSGLAYLWSEGVYPDREVAIGESWKVDARELHHFFGADFQKPEGEFEFKLARLVEHHGQTCAKITGKGQLKSQASNLGGASGAEQIPLEAEMDLSVEIYRSVELAMDLTVAMAGTLKLSNEADEGALRYSAASKITFSRELRKR